MDGYGVHDTVISRLDENGVGGSERAQAYCMREAISQRCIGRSLFMAWDRRKDCSGEGQFNRSFSVTFVCLKLTSYAHTASHTRCNYV